MELKILPIFQVFIAIAIMWLLSSLLPFLNYSDAGFNLAVILVLIFASFAGLLAIFSFRYHKTTVNPLKPETARKVVDSGIYAYSRNPMYLAMLLLLTAQSIYLANFACFTILPIFMIYMTKYQIIPEEKALTKCFGLEYQHYMSKVRRWV